MVERGADCRNTPELNTYVLPEYKPPTIKSAKQAGIHNNKIQTVFNIQVPIKITLEYKIMCFVTTIPSTSANTGLYIYLHLILKKEYIQFQY